MPKPAEPENNDARSAPDSPEKKSGSWWRKIIAGFGILLLVIVATVGFLIARPTRIDLSSFAPSIDEQITAALGREVSIDGAIVLITGVVPSIRIEKVTIDNPADWGHDKNFASLESFQTSIGLGELLERRINIDDVEVSGLTLSLERDADGRGNWEDFAPIPADDSANTPDSEAGEDSDTDGGGAGGINLEFSELGGIVVENLDVSYQNSDLPEPRRFHLDRLEGSAKSGEPIALSISGKLLDLPLTGDFTGGTLHGFRSRTSEWPVELAARLGDTTVRFDGHFSADNFTVPGQVDFEIDVPKPNQLVPLIGELPDFGSLRLEGEAIRSAPYRYSIADLSGELAGEAVTGEVELNLIGAIPQVDGRLKVAAIDLESFRRPTGDNEAKVVDSESAIPGGVAADIGVEAPPATDADSAASIASDQRLLPMDGTLELNIGELLGAVSGLEVRDLKLELRLAEKENSADLSLRFGGAPLHGLLTLTREPEQPLRFDLHLDSENADLTPIIAFYTGNDRFTGSFQRLDYRIQGSGESLADAWSARDVNLAISAAKMVYRADDEDKHFTLESGNFERNSGETGKSHLIGTIADAPFDVIIGFDETIPSTTGLSRILKLDGKIADAEISLSNQLEQRAVGGEAQFSFSVKGGRLDQLDAIYELNLPPMGPYSASGVFTRDDKMLELRDITLQIGSSHLSGLYRLEKGSDRSQVTLDLKSKSLQLNDVTFDHWSPINAENSPAPAADRAGDDAVQIHDILSYEALNQFDAAIKLDFGEVLSGRDKLGHGRLSATLENGRLAVSPLHLGIPGGSFQGEFSFHPKANRTVDWSLKLGAEGFELGVLARRSDPQSDFSAIANAQLDIGSRGAPYDRPHLKTASGSLDLDVCPRNVKAGALDIWATNLLVALLPKLDPKNESSVNCLIARFRVEDGIMQATTLGMDTTTLRVLAEGQIDLAREQYDLVLTPHPKRPQLLSLELPVGITGALNQPEIAMGKLPVVRAVGRLAKNTLLFPVKFLTDKRLPADGSDVCPCLEPKPDATPQGR